MTRFIRYVSISSFVLLCLWLFLPHSENLDSEDVALGTPVIRPATATTSKLAVTSTQAADTSRRPPKTTRKRPKSIPRARMTLREKLAADFPYDVESFFPAFIWQTWKTTPTYPDFAFRQQEATWTEKHPEYVHEVITDEVAYLLVEHLFQKTPEVLEAYDALPRVILKADFFRYLILLARGGIYTDIDTQCLKPCWDWVPARIPYDTYGLVIGIEADPDREDWQKWYSRRIQFVQWTLRAKAGHPALIEAVATVTERVLALHREGSLASLAPDKVVELTGPAMWTDAVFRTLNTDESHALQEGNLQLALDQEIDWQQMTGLKEQRQFGDIVVLPITGFSPGQGHMGSEPFDHPMAMVKHDFEGSWKPEDERMKDKDEKGRDVQWDKDGNIIPYAD